MSSFKWEEATILVTGATGTFGKKFVELVIKEKRPKKVIIFSRDELKQHEMQQKFPVSSNSPVRYFIGDVRDRDRLMRAFSGVDVVVHAAALKQVPACEYNPFEAVKTNVIGAQNIIDAAIDNGVKRVLALSTDKAVNPVNLYGATKLVAEKLFVHGNAYAGDSGTRFACVRYGNVVGSRGSVVPLFLKQRKSGRITVTDFKMTRFWITLEQGIHLVMKAIDSMHGGEIFIPKIPSMSLKDFAEALAPDCDHEIIGIRPGEKLHEALISYDEARHTQEFEDMFIIHPDHYPWVDKERLRTRGGKPVGENFYYASDMNPEKLTREQLLGLVNGMNEGAIKN